MEKTITIIAGLIFGYFLFKLINKKQKKLAGAYSDMSELQNNSEHAQEYSIPDILTNDKYKVKGQWER